ncbi:Steroidogenic acute regulatory protein-like [Gryllus bimaculatus]|nr:Steroidogenic acute regulatory protein-like [Gryllus bimaculatus]
MKFGKNSVEADDVWTREQFKAEAARILDVSWQVMHTAEWRLQKQSAVGDAFSAKPPGMNQIFKIKGVVDMAPEALLQLLFDSPDEYAKWNPVIVESLLLERVDERVHVSYQVTAERLGGLVARRDFVVLSAWQERDGALVLANVSVPHPAAPPPDTYIRGENRPGCYVIRPVPGESNKSRVEWYLDTNLKGWLPQKILDAAFCSILTENLKNLKNYISK